MRCDVVRARHTSHALVGNALVTRAATCGDVSRSLLCDGWISPVARLSSDLLRHRFRCDDEHIPVTRLASVAYTAMPTAGKT
ncbi:MAG: hypothetical protein QOG58_3033 [Caballeronia sp.]|jgi:hypothetical protein|nr:hypothetical protein [Caballeronia sp.]